MRTRRFVTPQTLEGCDRRRLLAPPPLDACGFELAAGGEDIAPPRCAHGRRIAGRKDDVGKRRDRCIRGTCVRGARPRVEWDQIDLGWDACEEPHQFASVA